MTGATAPRKVFQATPSISARAGTATPWARSWTTDHASPQVISFARGAARARTALDAVVSG